MAEKGRVRKPNDGRAEVRNRRSAEARFPGVGLPIMPPKATFAALRRSASARTSRADAGHSITSSARARIECRTGRPSELFKERVLDAAASSPTPVRWVVVAAEPVTSVDVTAADVLLELDAELHSSNIELCFAELKDPVKDKLRRFGLLAEFGEGFLFPTIDAAITSYVRGSTAYSDKPGARL